MRSNVGLSGVGDFANRLKGMKSVRDGLTAYS